MESRNPRHGALDAVLGLRIRARRRELHLSQSALGAKLGITFQQVQKYENGTNRVSATMLVKLAGALDLSVNSILQDADPSAGAVEVTEQSEQLLAAFNRIQSQDARLAVLLLVNSLAGR